MREKLAITLGIAGLAGMGCVGVLAVMVGSVAFVGLVFMVAAWFVNLFFEGFPALSYWESILLALGLWVVGIAVRIALGFLFGDITK